MEPARIEKLVPGGQGLATLKNGKKAFIWNALPGEIVNFSLTKSKASYCEGITSQVIKASPFRIPAVDDCFLSTSPWQTLDYNAELQAKRQLVKDCFAQQQLSVEVLPTITDGKDFFYRNKMEYSLYWDNITHKIYPAFHLRGTHRKIPIKKSSIEMPTIFTAAQNLINQLNAKQLEARRFQSILIRADQTGKTSLALFENHQPHPKMTPLRDTLLEHTYTYSPNGFFQINLPVYELALNTIKATIDDRPILDLYSGVGSIGLSVATTQNLTFVEVNNAAFQELQNNIAATQNHRKTPPPRAVLAKSEDATNFIQPDQTIILDPPRAGCDRAVIETIINVTPSTIAYLSCNPITQARDLKPLLKSKAYQLIALQPFNFFPRTPHIENLAILKRRS